MYEGSRNQKLAIRKSPSMPMLDIDMINVEKWGSMNGRCKTPTAPTRKLRSAITLCVGILVCTLVLVGLDPAKVAEEPWRGGPRMRVTLPIRWSAGHGPSSHQQGQGPEPALEGMGMLFRRGTRAMPQLVVAHLAESTTADELRLFLRGLHRSGMPSHADVVLLFPFRPVPNEFLTVIGDEETSFQKLLKQHPPSSHEKPKLSVFNSAAYWNTQLLPDSSSGRQDSIWGHRHHNDSHLDSPELEPAAEPQPQYGAIVGFDVQELDADDALSGFVNSPPIHLRRWLCYQMLLGMVRHKYRHALVTEVTGVVILADALALKKRDPGQLHLFATTLRWSNSTIRELYGPGVWNALDEDEKRRKVISSGVILGGVRPVRAVATAMATEIVRVAMLRKKKDFNSGDDDSSLLSYLVHRSSALGRKVASHLQVHESGSSVNVLPSKTHDLFNRRNESRFALIQGLHTDDFLRHKVMESLRRDHCQSELDIYTDCYTTTTS